MPSPAPDSSGIEMRGEISAEDIVIAQAIHRRGNRIWKILSLLFAGLAALIFVDTISRRHQKLGGIIVDPRQLEGSMPATADEEREQMGLAWCLVPTAVGLLAFAFLYPRRAWHPYEAMGSSVARTITSDGVEVNDSAAHAFIPWESVRCQAVAECLSVIYTRTVPTALIFPRRMFSNQDEWERFRRLVDTRVL